jgi:hypothetical protein
MKRWMQSQLTFANVMSVIAVTIALGGTAYAAVELPKNSVGSSQIKSNAVKSADVKNGALKSKDFKAGQLPAGPQGAPGEAAAFARVQGNGTLLPALADFPATAKGVTDANITHPAAGIYCIDLAFRPASALVALDNAGANTPAGNAFSVSVATERGNNIAPCTGMDARIATTNWTETVAPTATDHGFIIWFEEG